MIETLNRAADSWWVYVFHASWQAALIAGVALAIIFAFKRLPSPWRYALLMVALAKFAVPPLMSHRVGLFHWSGVEVARVEGSGFGVRDRVAGVEIASATAEPSSRPRRLEVTESLGLEDSTPATPNAEASSPVSTPHVASPSFISNLKSQISNLTWKSWLMLLHALGSVTLLLWIAHGLYQLTKLTRRAELLRPQATSRKPQASLLPRFLALSKRLDLKEEPDLLISPDDLPPVAFWLLRPKVMVPRSLVEKLPASELDTVLAHELAHHRRNDWAANLFQLLLLAAWWFNPLLWVLSRATSRVREECCDDLLLGAGLTQPETYCRTLLSAAKEMDRALPLGATLGFAETYHHPMEERIKRIMDLKLHRSEKLSPVAFAFVALLGIAVLPGLRSRAADPPEKPAPPVATFRAKVVDHETGKPVEGLTLYGRSDQKIRGQSDAEGRVEIEGVPQGTFDFQVESKSHGRWWSEACIEKSHRFEESSHRRGWQRNFDYLDFQVKPGMEEVTLVVERGVRVRGTVVDPDGKPVGGATVAPALSGTGNSITGDTRYSYPTAEDGTFEMLLPASHKAAYNLVAHDGKFGEWRAWANGHTWPIRTKPGEEVEGVVIQLQKPGSMRGTVVDKEGKPVAGREVTASPRHQFGNRYYNPQTKTDESGSFELRYVEPGMNHVYAGMGSVVTVQGIEETGRAFSFESGQVLKNIQIVATEPQSNEEGQRLQIERFLREAGAPEALSEQVLKGIRESEEKRERE